MDPALLKHIREILKESAKRKCFISYHASDAHEVEGFLGSFGDVFIPKVIGVSDSDDFIESENNDYIMTKIRKQYIVDSTVTICLIGKCTHSRRYIDWELKTSLRRGPAYIPNGLLGITLPSSNGSAHLPPRFRANWSNAPESYALYHSYPTSHTQLRAWIEEAYSRRINRAELIQNSASMMKYSRSCSVCKVTH